MTAGTDDIVDLFAGPGGWSEGLRSLGLADLGIECDEAAVATRSAAGHLSLRADVSSLDPAEFAPVAGLIASPPCPAFSQAGDGRGREVLDELVAAVYRRDWLAMRDHDPGVWLVLEVGRWAEVLQPEWIACEQVPPVLPLWQAYEHALRSFGYSTWAGVLNAADFGVPQTRRRAFLLASRTSPAHPPEPTHAKDAGLSLFGEAAPWISMADALGWGTDGFIRQQRGAGMLERHVERRDHPAAEPAPTVTAGATRYSGGPRWHVERGTVLNPGISESQPNRRRRPADEPAPTLAFGHDAAGWRWEPGEEPTHLDRRAMYREGAPTAPEVPVSEPAPTIIGALGNGVFVWRNRRNDQSGSDETDPDWPLERPATTIAGRDLVTDPGANANRFNGAEKSRNDGYRITVEEAAVLQGFPPGYPWRGPKSKVFEQIGNAVPPPVAAAVVAALTNHQGATP